MISRNYQYLFASNENVKIFQKTKTIVLSLHMQENIGFLYSFISVSTKHWQPLAFLNCKTLFLVAKIVFNFSRLATDKNEKLI